MILKGICGKVSTLSSASDNYEKITNQTGFFRPKIVTCLPSDEGGITGGNRLQAKLTGIKVIQGMERASMGVWGVGVSGKERKRLDKSTVGSFWNSDIGFYSFSAPCTLH